MSLTIHSNAQELTWTVYDTSNSDLLDNRIVDIAIDSSSGIWVLHPSYYWTEIDSVTGARSRGNINKLSYLDGDNWSYLEYSETMGDFRVIEVGHDKNLWIGCSGTGVFVYDGLAWTNHILPGSHLNHWSVSAIAFDHNDNVWFAHAPEFNYMPGGVSKFDGENWMHYNTPGRSTYDIEIDSINNVWVRGGGGLLKFNGSDWQSYIDEGYGSDITIDKNNRIWLCGNRSVSVFDGEEFFKYDSTNSHFKAKYVNTITCDKNNHIWIGTSDGLFHFNRATFVQYDTSNSKLPSNSIGTLAVDKENNIWIGTREGLVKLSGDFSNAVRNPNDVCMDYFTLLHNYPNPFNASTYIRFSLNNTEHVKIFIFNQNGQLIDTLLNKKMSSGDHHVIWNSKNNYGSDVPSGIYLCVLEVGNLMQTTRKLILLK